MAADSQYYNVLTITSSNNYQLAIVLIGKNGSGGWSRTTNAQVMGLLSYRCSTPHRKVAVCVDVRNISYTKRTHWPMFPS